MKKVAHWCCGRCGKTVVPVGAKGVEAKMREHLKTCLAAVFQIKLLTQGN